MILLHCFIPGYWDNIYTELSNANFVKFMGSFKLCVGIFTFMVGYGYYFSKTKDLRYSLVHIRKLLVPFWVILFVFTLPVCYDMLNRGVLLLNLVGVNSSLNWFSWFVAFYIYAMIVMPFCSRLTEQKPVSFTAALIIVAFLAEVALHELYPSFSGNDWTQRLFDCLLHTPCMLLGYLFAKKHWLQTLNIPDKRYMPLLAVCTIVAVLFIRVLCGAVVGFNMDFFYAPIVILCILVLFNGHENTLIGKCFKALGEASVYMWFLHALFFTEAVRHVYQPLVRISDYLWINTLWVIAFTYVCSWCLMKATNFITHKIASK